MPRYQADLAASNNRLYSAGGPGPAASVYFAILNATGGFTGWTATQPLPQADSAPGLTAYGGYQQYNGSYVFAETVMLLKVDHEVAPKELALGRGNNCGDCHLGDRIDWPALGWTADPVEGGEQTLP